MVRDGAEPARAAAPQPGGCLELLVVLRSGVTLVTWWLCSAVLLGVLALGGDGPGGVDGLIAVTGVLAVAGPVLLYVLVKPLCLAGRLLARRFGRHRVTGALVLLYVLVIVAAALAGLVDGSAGTGVGVGVLAASVLTPPVAVYAALRRDRLPEDGEAAAQRARAAGARRQDLAWRAKLRDYTGRAPAVRFGDEVLHRERMPLAWTLLCLSGYAAGITWMWVDLDAPDHQDLTAWLLISGVLLLFPVAPLLIEPAMKFRYNRITLTPEVLRVGRHRVAVAELLPGRTASAAPGAPPPAPFRAAARQPGRLLRLGGRPQWSGAPMGWTTVFIPTTRDDVLAIASRRPERLTAALSRVAERQTVG
ncbi:hypothetical protein [Allonocardiopsis opalescens]|uniref:hypothetical protein n=1 Tax=Allonocardiopsis opalescens TaxID=1144618 RepID=UPI000D077BA7|nr:hypothetical protein [Allonocardiopsis opalescens]